MPAHAPIPAAACAQRPLACAAIAHTHKYTNPLHTECNVNVLRNGLNESLLPLGPALGSPALHGVAGSPPELNYAERSKHRAVPLAPHFQPATTETLILH